MESQYFQIECLLGQGQFGNVFKGVCKQTQEICAAKIMNLDRIRKKATMGMDGYSEDDKQEAFVQYVTILTREINLLKTLEDNENIIGFKQCHKEGNDIILLLELCDDSLDSYIKSLPTKGMQEKEALECFVQIMNGLSFLHVKNIIHRDLKPDNILIKQGIYKIADLGFAKQISDLRSNERKKNIFMTQLGTPGYQAPEVQSDEGYNFSADIWSMGCIFFFILFGEDLFKIEGINVFKLTQKGFNFPYLLQYLKSKGQKIEEAEKKLNSLSSETINLLSQMLTYDPEERPTPEQLLESPAFNQINTKYQQTRQQSIINFSRVNITKGLKQTQNQKQQQQQQQRYVAPVDKKDLSITPETNQSKEFTDDQTLKAEKETQDNNFFQQLLKHNNGEDDDDDIPEEECNVQENQGGKNLAAQKPIMESTIKRGGGTNNFQIDKSYQIGSQIEFNPVLKPEPQYQEEWNKYLFEINKFQFISSSSEKYLDYDSHTLDIHHPFIFKFTFQKLYTVMLKEFILLLEKQDNMLYLNNFSQYKDSVTYKKFLQFSQRKLKIAKSTFSKLYYAAKQELNNKDLLQYGLVNNEKVINFISEELTSYSLIKEATRLVFGHEIKQIDNQTKNLAVYRLQLILLICMKFNYIFENNTIESNFEKPFNDYKRENNMKPLVLDQFWVYLDKWLDNSKPERIDSQIQLIIYKFYQ